jgi:hypothetical protein
VRYLLKYLPPIVKRLRQMSPLDLKMGLSAQAGKEKKVSLPKAFTGGQTPHFLRKRNSK